MANKFLIPTDGKGKELQELLRRELGIPNTATSFEVRFAIDEVITVKCEYLAELRPENG